MSRKYSFPKDKINIALLEGIHAAAAGQFKDASYKQIDTHAAALAEDELIAYVQDVHVLGIRSKTQLTRRVLENAPHLLAVGCFCIGTNQVDIEAASQHGVAVFNAPFSNTRSVAELTIAEVVMLARRATERSQELHRGTWTKSAAGSFEVRNKTLGIVGYGHIGPQVGLLAEALGMNVLFYDVRPKLAMSNARSVGSLEELLASSDFVTLHVPETAETRGMISATELQLMKQGSYLLNLSRGTVVDIAALATAIESGHIAGAAVDVYPQEPKSNEEEFESPLRGLSNVILTPHIGGSTQEAQKNIGIEVSSSLVRFVDTGSTSGSVNFPPIDLAPNDATHRVLNVHRNVPGVLSQINQIIADMGVNISGQYLGTTADIGYLIMDVGKNVSKELKRAIDEIDASIRTRLLF